MLQENELEQAYLGLLVLQSTKFEFLIIGEKNGTDLPSGAYLLALNGWLAQ